MLESILIYSVIVSGGIGIGYCVERCFVRDCAGCGCDTYGTYCEDCMREIGVGD